jgi:hypothetical protein
MKYFGDSKGSSCARVVRNTTFRSRNFENWCECLVLMPAQRGLSDCD